MKYGYKRVSTIKQGTKGNSLDDQERALREAGAEAIYSDTYTGTKLDRPQFAILCEKLTAGDELIVTKLDRLARTATEGASLVKELMARGVTVTVLNMGRIDNSPIGTLTMQVLFAFAEFERDMIVERTQTGKAVAREKGVRVDGRPNKYTQYQMDHALSLIDEGNSYSTVEKLTGISVSTLVRAKRNRKK